MFASARAFVVTRGSFVYLAEIAMAIAVAIWVGKKEKEKRRSTDD